MHKYMWNFTKKLKIIKNKTNGNARNKNIISKKKNANQWE